MADSSAQLHERFEDLSTEALDRHRAVVSLMEELEAIDWYQQRIEATHDEELKAILAHNRDEEMEHAAMSLAWLERRIPRLAAELEDYLFQSGSIAGTEEHDHRGDDAGDGSLGLGSLRP